MGTGDEFGYQPFRKSCTMTTTSFRMCRIAFFVFMAITSFGCVFCTTPEDGNREGLADSFKEPKTALKGFV